LEALLCGQDKVDLPLAVVPGLFDDPERRKGTKDTRGKKIYIPTVGI
jgi:hypothetical protein